MSLLSMLMPSLHASTRILALVGLLATLVPAIAWAIDLRDAALVSGGARNQEQYGNGTA